MKEVSNTHLNGRFATGSSKSWRADALELANSIEASATVGARVRFAFVVLEIALGSSESCGYVNTHKIKTQLWLA